MEYFGGKEGAFSRLILELRHFFRNAHSLLDSAPPCNESPLIFSDLQAASAEAYNAVLEYIDNAIRSISVDESVVTCPVQGEIPNSMPNPLDRSNKRLCDCLSGGGNYCAIIHPDKKVKL